MAIASWLAAEEALSPAALTVLAQTVPPNDMGNLLWDSFYRRENVNSVDLSDITALDYRPVADRREWNGNGRLIPMQTPARRKVSMVPIEARDKINEYEMQKLMEAASGNAAQLRNLIGAEIPQRVERLADSDYRRLEIDCMTAWSAGTITQRNPETGQTYVASFGFDTARYTTEGTAWNDAGLNAYDKLLAWLAAAEDKVGPVEGVVLRLATLNVILADAPNLPNSVKMTRPQLADRITQDQGRPFEFFVLENSHDVFTDGGTSYTRTKIWPAQKIAAVPQGGIIGRVAFAPVTRSMDLVAQLPNTKIDTRGVSVYYFDSNDGKELSIEAQLNAIPIPEESLLYVTNVGV